VGSAAAADDDVKTCTFGDAVRSSSWWVGMAAAAAVTAVGSMTSAVLVDLLGPLQLQQQ